MAVAIAVTACGWAAAADAPPPPPAGGAGPTSCYVRYADDGHGGGAMQAAVGHFADGDGVTVDLLATAHVGEADFFRQLSDRFPAYDAVLYELVAPRGVPPTAEGVNAQQRQFARDTGLENQGRYLTYRRKNFVHADLDLEQIKRLEIAARGTFKGALGDGPSAVLDPAAAADFAAAGKAKNRLEHQRLYRRACGRELVAESQPPPGQTLPPGLEVLVGARNDEVMRVLRQQVAAGRRKLAVLYGAGHMVDLEHRLLAAGYERQSVEWVTVWTVAPDGTPTTRPKAAAAERR